MRSTPLVGERAWFGPRRLGWGLSPISPEGWAVTVAAVAASVAIKRREDLPTWVPALIMAPFVILFFLKGTSPGGPRARSEFEASRSAEKNQ